MSEQKRPLTPSFTCEFQLVVTSQDEAELERRFEAARQHLNALIGEAQRRLRRLQDSQHAVQPFSSERSTRPF